MTAPTKIKFSNKVPVPNDTTVLVLPCKNREERTHFTDSTSCAISYEFDNDDSLPVFLKTDTWYSLDDLDELIALLKGVKKRAVKLIDRRTCGF